MEERFMLEAIAEARLGINNGHGGPFGAVIVKDGKIVGRGHNQVIKNQDATCHGEMMAIRDASKNLNSFDLSGCEIYTTGYPCPMCMGAILWANIDKVYYGCDVHDTEKIGFRDNAFYEKLSSEEEKKSFIKEIGRKECLDLYGEYMKIQGGANY
ncbi:MAG: nucleoside deaminase [Bacillota bacterium]|nr:nucleoside deaminase [Bacillota bacterium]